MKRLTILTLALLAIVGRVFAQESVSVNAITVPQGGEAFLEINYSLEGTSPYVGFLFHIELPDGLTLSEDPDGDPGYPWYDEDVTAISRMSITTTQAYGFAGTPKTAAATINGSSGVLMRVKVSAADNLPVGNTYTGKITELSFNVRDDSYNVSKISLSDVNFSIKIGEAGSVVLDENSSSPIMDGAFDKLVLKRTFAAGWNTVCLPFDVDDVEEVFGEGSRAYAFTGYSGGELKFSSTESLNATKPYVIYMPVAITEIELEDIEIDEGSVQSSYTLKSKAYFRGTYVPVAPEGWTKKADTDVIYGVTTEGRIAKAGAEASIKGFRGYFDLPAGSEVKALHFIDAEDGIVSPFDESEEPVYNLAGQRMNQMQEGVNITNGKKILK